LVSFFRNMANARLTASSVAGHQPTSFEAGWIRGFDGLRAIAFLLVFISHKIYFAHADSIGDIGVWLFFVLSGFLITRILARSRREIEGRAATVLGSISRFYLRRTARIFPPYYLVLAFFALISYFMSIDDFGTREKLAYFFYGTNLLVAAQNRWVGDFGHFWSLAVEEQFYLVFAPLVLLVPRRHTVGVCLGMMLTGVATKIALEVEGASEVAIDVNSLVNFALLGLGGVISLNANRSAPKWLTSGAAQGAILGLYVALPAAFGTWAHFWPLLGKLSAVLAGVLLFQIFRGQQSWFVAILESGPLRYLGRISYGAYLFHHFLHFSSIEPLLHELGAGPVPTYIQVLAELAATLVLATMSWLWLEKPTIAWARRITSRRMNETSEPALSSRVQPNNQPKSYKAYHD
jgi:peptidoglycan/LPS O-acetylase OafA/YrhL